MGKATRVLASTIGVICGISGLEHGFFEVLQGNVTSEIHMISGRPMIFVFCHSIVTAVFGFFYGVDNPEIINQILYGMLYFMIGLLPLVIISALAHDSLEANNSNPEVAK